MIRQHLPTAMRGEAHFRWRGGDVSRIEGLSDAVFALSLTLLVVSLEVPSNFNEMVRAFRHLPAFAACFLILMMCWYFHFLFHRRYGLEDFGTIALNAALLFVVLFYVYPLKFLFTLLFDAWLGFSPADQSGPAIQVGQMKSLMLLYSGGFSGIFGLFALLELRAWSKRDALQLDERERMASRSMLRSHLISVGFGVASITLTLAHPSLIPYAGIIYMLIGPVQTIHGVRSGNAIERLGSPT